MIETLASLVFIIGGLPISFLLLKGAGAILLAPSLTSVLAIFAAIAHVILDLPIAWLWAGLVFISLVFLGFARFREIAKANLAAVRERGQQFQLYGFLVFSALAALSAPAPVGWDARSMWFAIPSWLNGPAEYYLTAQSGGAETGWPEYPFFSPAAFATIWQVSGVDENLWLASRFGGVVAVSLAALTAWFLIERFGKDRSPWVNTAASLLFVSSAFFIADGTLNNGYQDATQALSVTALLAAGLWWLKDHKVSSSAVVSILALAAANVKQEGFWFALGILLLASLYRSLRGEYWFLISLGPLLIMRVIWSAFGAAVGMPDSGSTVGMGEKIPELLQPASQAWAVINKIMTEWFPVLTLGTFLLAVVAAAALAVPGSGLERVEALRLALVVLAAPIGLFLVITVTYALGSARDSIDWWLGTSYSRITATPIALVYLLLAIAAIVLAPAQKVKVLSAPKGTSKKTKR